MERQFRWITDVRPAEIPVGKALLLLLSMALPGKLTTKLVRFLLGLTGKLTGRTLYRWANVIGPLVGAGEAYAFKKWCRGFLGETGAEALALGTLAGAIDAGFERETIAELDKDLTDRIADPVRDKIVALVRKLRAGGLPEAGSSGWREQLPWLAGSKAGRPARTAGPGLARTSSPRLAAVGSPQKPVDPIQLIEETLRAKSRH